MIEAINEMVKGVRIIVAPWDQKEPDTVLVYCAFRVPDGRKRAGTIYVSRKFMEDPAANWREWVADYIIRDALEAAAAEPIDTTLNQ